MDHYAFTLISNGKAVSFVSNRRGFRSALGDAFIAARTDFVEHKPVVRFDLTKREALLSFPFRFENSSDIFDDHVREYWRQREAVYRLIQGSKLHGPSRDEVAG